MAKCLIGLGSNLNDREATLLAAWEAIGRFPATSALRLSSLLSTQPVGGPPNQPQFSNAVGLIETDLAPAELLDVLLALEHSLGRVRQERWGPRTIDLDLLLHGETIVRSPQLILPHPRLAFRRFVLEPAAEIAPDFIYPLNGWTIRQLLNHLNAAPRTIVLTALDCQVLGEAVQQIRARVVVSVVPSLNENSADAAHWQLVDRWPLEDAASPGSPAMGPRLVVLADAPDDKSEVAENRRRRWNALRHRCDVGPLLWLHTNDPAEIADEVVAAMAAMR